MSGGLVWFGCICALMVGVLGSVAVRAEVRLPALLSENAVLQRERPIRIWGWAEPGERVSVRLGEQEAVATTDTDGKWALRLAPMAAGGPMSMTVEGRNRLTIENVLIGDVWICSGQSNMKFTLRRCDGGAREAASADFPLMRLFTVKRTAAPQPQPDCPGRWAVCSEESAGKFSGVGYFFGRELHQNLGVPVGLIQATSCCTATIQSFMSRSALQADPAFAEVLKSTEELAEAHRRGGLESPEARYAGKSPPTWLFNGMIAPLRRFTIRGVIWYQGESNVREPVLYRKLFPAMIRDWRSQWGQGNFPFLFAQMANFQRRPHPPFQSRRAEIREAQLMALALPATGMAVTIDIGDPKRVYPLNKRDVGRRLALAAMAIAYGRDVSYSGPIYRSMSIEGGAVRIRFDHADGGLVTSDGLAPGSFAIAGQDRQFVQAQARIDGQTVVVHSDRVPEPVAVRYGWADSPRCNLYNAAGLPASPFRTDDWPGAGTDPPQPDGTGGAED